MLFVEPGIGYLFTGGEVTELFNLDLGLSRSNPIQGEFQIVNGCERIIYWNDGVNPDRYYNLDKPDRFTTADDFRLVPAVQPPCISAEEKAQGGRLEYGSYIFVLEQLDATLNILHRSMPTSPVRVGRAHNISKWTADNGGQPVSNSAIQISISDVSEQAVYLKIGVIQFVSGDGITRSAHYIGQLLPASVTSFVYQGINVSSGDTYVDADQLLIPMTTYETSNYMEQVHGKLLRFNLIEQSVDMSEFQKSASKIGMKYAVQELDPGSDALTEQGDEVKAYSIVYLFNTGRLTPAFHIPGRAAIASDTEEITTDVTSATQRWQLYNTAIPDSTPLTGYASSGKLGYYECAATYDNPTNYCGDDYWGEDVDGNSLAGTPVRHSRIPCRTIEPLLSDDGKLRYIGIHFYNVEYPHPDIVGHFFLSSEYTLFNRTVVASGYSLPFNYLGDVSGDKREGRYIHYLPNSDDREAFSNNDKQNLITLEYLSSGRAVQGSFMKINGYLESDHEQNRPEFKKFFKGNADLQLFGKHHETTGYVAEEEFISITRSLHLPYSSVTFDYPNRSMTSNFNVLEIGSDPTIFSVNRSNLNYAYVKSAVQPHSNLYGIRYRLMHTCPLTSESEVLFSGDSYISTMDITNISRVSADDFDFSLAFALPIVGPSFLLAELLERDQIDVEYEWIKNLHFESPLNFNRRHQGLDCNTYYDNSRSIDKFIQSRVSEQLDADNDRKHTLKSSFCLEYYGYNQDYSADKHQRIFYGPSQVFDYCSACLNKRPTGIVYSEESSNEQTVDGWRVYKSLNYVDLPAHRGEIIAADYYEQALIIRCKYGSFLMRPSPQEIQTNGVTIYLGTGSFLSIPPEEGDTSILGTGGQQSKLASTLTPYGLVWYDQIQGKVIQFNGRFSEISRNGMYHFFERYMTLKMRQSFPDVDEQLFGGILTYDPKFERLILHKKDFVPVSSDYELTDDGFLVDGVLKPFTDAEYTVNQSVTMSYSFRTNSWLSFHSYNPDYMFYLGTGLKDKSKTFFSVRETELYAHDEHAKFCQFYGTDFDHVVSAVYSSAQTTQFHALHYYATVEQYDSDSGKWKDVLTKTFNKALAFTRYQCSGLFDLLLTKDPLEEVTWSTTRKTVIQTDRNYRIAGIRDISESNPTMSESWTLRQLYYTDGQGYIDALPINVDQDKPQHEQLLIRDKYVELRLFFKASDYRVITHLMEFRNLPSLR